MRFHSVESLALYIINHPELSLDDIHKLCVGVLEDNLKEKYELECA